MSIENTPKPHSESLDDLELMFTDPFIERTLQLARTYNDIFQQSDPTHDEKNEIVKELDACWGSINKEHINITGKVRVKTETERDGKIYFFDDQTVISNGFTIIDEPLYMDGEVIKQNSRLVYHVYVPAEAIGLLDEGEGVVFGATAEIDGAFLEFNKASMERAVPWLTYAKPELLEDVDTRLFSVDGTEADSVFAMRNLTLPDDFEQESELTKNSFIHYLNEVIEFDTSLPYEVSMEGELYVIKTDEPDPIKYEVDIKKVLIYIRSITYLQERGGLNDSKLRLVLDGLLIGYNKQDENIPVRVPIESLRSIKTVRSRYS